MLTEYQNSGLRLLCQQENNLPSGGIVCEGYQDRTRQFIALILANKPEKDAKSKTTLLVVPFALMERWIAELKENAPEVSFAVYHGSHRIKELASLEQNEVLVTSYGTLVSELKLKKSAAGMALFQTMFFRVIAEEAQHLRNVKTKRFNALARVKSEGRRWAAPDTLIHNSEKDIRALTKFVGSNVDAAPPPPSTWFILGDPQSRGSCVRKPPPCNRHRELIPLSSDEKAMLQRLWSEFESKTAREGKRRGCNIMTAMTRMRHLCSGVWPLHDTAGKPKSPSRQNCDSSKVQRVVDLIKSEPGRKTIAFLSFLPTLSRIAATLLTDGIQCRIYEGRLSAQQRSRVLEEFDSDQNLTVLLFSYRTRTTEPTIMTASKVIMVDPWWNPAIADEAVNLVCWPGQTKKVDVYELVVENSIEEHVYQVQDKKRAMAIARLAAPRDAIDRVSMQVSLNSAKVAYIPSNVCVFSHK